MGADRRRESAEDYLGGAGFCFARWYDVYDGSSGSRRWW